MDDQRIAAAVAETLDVPVEDAPVQVLGTVPNTSDRARALGHGDAPHGAFVVAESLTAARGRDGSDWSAPPGGVWSSVLLRTDLGTDEAGRITIAGGVAAWEAVRSFGVDAGIEWPNDVVVAGADDARGKIAGVLTELVVDAVPVAGKPVEDAVPGADPGDLEFAVLGVGLNADLDPGDVDAGDATTMRAELHEPVDPTAVAAALHERLVVRCDQVETSDGFAALLGNWRDASFTRGERVRATRRDGGAVVGTAVDVSDTGALVVETDDGGRTTLAATDVQRLRRS